MLILVDLALDLLQRSGWGIRRLPQESQVSTYIFLSLKFDSFQKDFLQFIHHLWNLNQFQMEGRCTYKRLCNGTTLIFIFSCWLYCKALLTWAYLPTHNDFTLFDCKSSSKIYWQGQFIDADRHALKLVMLLWWANAIMK